MTAAAVAAEVRGRRRTVLVLDDDRAVRAAIRRALTLHDFTVIEAGNAMEALDLLRSHLGPIHLILCDLVLPGLSGREAANMLLARRPDTPLVYMSGFSSADSFRKELERDGAPFLAKPFDIAELLASVSSALGE